MDQERDVVMDASPSASGGFVGSPDSSEPPARRHAVIIGIDQYEDSRIPNLRYAKADAEAIYQVLTDPALGRVPSENVQLLLNAQATERKIRWALADDLPRRAGKHDTVLVYFAGHGAPVGNPRVKSNDGMEKYLLPADANVDNLRSTGIPMEAVQKYFEYLDSNQVFFFIDSCYSGVAGGRTFERPDYQARAGLLTNEFLDHFGAEGRVVITACDVNEVSLESHELGHGLFTHYLTEGLKGAADLNKDGFVTLQELYEYVQEHVSSHAQKLSRRMNPVQKGSVRGRIFLTRYETDAQRRARESAAEAEKAELAEDLDLALRIWKEVLQVTPNDRRAGERVSDIMRRREEEERSRRERLERIIERLYQLHDDGHLSDEDYETALSVVNQDPQTRTKLDQKIFSYVERLAAAKISAQTYLISVRQAKRQPSSADSAESETGTAAAPSQQNVSPIEPTGRARVPAQTPLIESTPQMSAGLSPSSAGVSSVHVASADSATPPSRMSGSSGPRRGSPEARPITRMEMFIGEWQIASWPIRILAIAMAVGLVVLVVPGWNDSSKKDMDPVALAGASQSDSSATPATGSDHLYDSALVSLRNATTQNDARNARLILHRLLEEHPVSDRAPAVLFAIGESLVRTQPDSATYYLNQVVANHGSSSYAAPALYQLGRVAERRGRYTDATGIYRRIIHDYQVSGQADSARTRISVLEKAQKPKTGIAAAGETIPSAPGGMTRPDTGVGLKPEAATLSEPNAGGNQPSPSGEKSPSAPVPPDDRVYLESELDDPVRAISMPSPRYPPVLQSAGIAGEVDLQFVVDTNGRAEPGSFKVLKASHPAFTEPATQAARTAEFKPAIYRGHKVRQLVQQRMSFKPAQ